MSNAIQRTAPPAAITLPHVARHVQDETARRGCSVAEDATSERFSRLATAEVLAAGEVPYDPAHRVSDDVDREKLTVARAAFQRYAREERAAHERLMSAEQALASLPAAPSRWEVGFTIGGGLAGVALVGYAISSLLPESIDLFIKRPYYVETWGHGAVARGAWAAEHVARLVACSVAIVPMLMALLSRGRISGFQKILLFGLELLFAAAFGAIRITEAGFSPQVIAYSGFEFALAGIGMLLCFHVADTLRRAFDLRAPRLDADAGIRDARAWYQRAVARLATAEAGVEGAVDGIRQRERDAERRPRLSEVARMTAEDTYVNGVIEAAHQVKHPFLFLHASLPDGGRHGKR